MNKFLEFYVSYYYIINFIIIVLIATGIGSIISFVVDFFTNKSNFCKSSQTFEVNGVPVSGHEEDYLLIDNQNTISMSGLLVQQGLKRISWREQCAFELRVDDPDDYFLPVRQQYVAKTGNILPPVYRIKFNITAEPLSDEDTKRFWEKQIWDIT